MTSGEQQSGIRGAINELFGRGERRPEDEDVRRHEDGRADLGAGDRVGHDGAADAGVAAPGRPRDDGWGPAPGGAPATRPDETRMDEARMDEARMDETRSNDVEPRHELRDEPGRGDGWDGPRGGAPDADPGPRVADRRDPVADAGHPLDDPDRRSTPATRDVDPATRDVDPAAATDRQPAVGGAGVEDRSRTTDVGDLHGGTGVGDRTGDRTAGVDTSGRDVGPGAAGVPDGDGVPTTAAGAPGRDTGTAGASTDDDAPERLVTSERAASYGSRWDEIKGDFVDEPRKAVTDADNLVGELLDELQTLFTKQRQSVVHGLDTDETSTEDLRLAFRRYRSFFDRLLSI